MYEPCYCLGASFGCFGRVLRSGKQKRGVVGERSQNHKFGPPLNSSHSLMLTPPASKSLYVLNCRIPQTHLTLSFCRPTQPPHCLYLPMSPLPSVIMVPSHNILIPLLHRYNLCVNLRGFHISKVPTCRDRIQQRNKSENTDSQNK